MWVACSVDLGSIIYRWMRRENKNAVVVVGESNRNVEKTTIVDNERDMK